jgi:hypothetical protein
MISYAIDDFMAVSELYSIIYPSKQDDNTYETPPTTTSNRKINFYKELSDISEDELIELPKPKFDKKPAPSCQIYNQPGESIITTSQQEINELNPPEQEPAVPEPEPSTPKQAKKEK